VKVAVGCAGFLVVLAAVIIAADRVAGPALPPELRYAVVVPAGLLLALGLSNVWSLLRGYGSGARSRGAVLEQAHRGEAPSQDGPIVATGVARAEGQPLQAPISGVECVAYQYRLYILQWRHKRRRDEVPIYWGYASRPFRIDSPTQAFRIVAVPQLADEMTPHDSADAKTRAKAYVAATRFEPKRAMIGVLSTVATSFKELAAEPSGEVRRDWMAEDTNIGVDALRLEETVVPVGATVSVAGRWSAERRAIVPGQIGEAELGVTLVGGPAENLWRAGSSGLPWSRVSVALTAVLLLSAGSTLLWLSTTGRIAEWWRAR
jgi:hypothetical protein